LVCLKVVDIDLIQLPSPTATRALAPTVPAIKNSFAVRRAWRERRQSSAVAKCVSWQSHSRRKQLKLTVRPVISAAYQLIALN
jgi:hypothetical protein